MAGVDGNGGSRGKAISVSGDNNTVELGLGAVTVGAVQLSGTGNRLQLGGGSTVTVFVDGSLGLGVNGIYAVRATPTAFDRLDVSGSAELAGATVQVLAQPGAYSERFSQVVLTAAGTFGGSRFAGVTSDLAYLTPSLSYSADDKGVTLTLSRKITPVDPGGNGGTDPTPGGGTPLRFADLVSGSNARAVADAVETLPTSHSVYGAAINLPVGGPQGFFSALSGEVHATVGAGLNNLSGTVRNVPLGQLRGNLAAGSTAGAPTAAAGVSDAAPPASALPASQARPVWAQLVGNWQNIGATGNNAAARQHTGGVIAGADRDIGSGWRLGGAVGYTDSRLSVDDRASQADISSYSAILYGGKAFALGAGKLNVLAGAAYSWHDIHTRRQIGVGGLDQTLTADYGGNTTQVFTELGYAVGVANGLTMEPYAGIAWAGQRVRGFSESGGSAALSGASSTSNTTTTTLGLRGKQAVTLGTMAGSVSAGLGWRHAFGDVAPVSRLAFNAGQAFNVTGAPISRDAALVELGADLAVSRSATIGVAYAGQYASANQDHTGRLEVRWQF
ncbi:autotransporter outer membrane beta-barrel domain-containing protein [Achromobacter sp. UMC71]|nr:autotransporter outer membrane beta-barrel domain-containing protein [Achromobacter sp. UMC71]